MNLEHVKAKCRENNVELLYLTKFGSHLYGTSTPNSDTDYKGIFLPSLESCILQKNIKHITFSTGKNNSKNDKNDVDVQLWSLQYFLSLVSNGETNALDLLYSYTNQAMVEFTSPIMNTIFDNHDKLYNIKNCNAFVGYAIGQAKKYGVRGSRLGVIKNINNELLITPFDDNDKITDFIKVLDEKFHHDSFCFLKELNGVQSIIICGKAHQGNITFKEFYDRIAKEFKQYGSRAILAEQNKGIDWKALSHAVRALFQMEELIEFGSIQYPLWSAPFISNIKQGNVSFLDVEKLIFNHIDIIHNMLSKIGDSNKRDNSFIDHIILSAYNN